MGITRFEEAVAKATLGADGRQSDYGEGPVSLTRITMVSSSCIKKRNVGVHAIRDNLGYYTN
jgi:hypothetical protein